MANSIIIENLLANTKSETLRLYSKPDVGELGKTLCAFLNKDGGDVLIGIGKDEKPSNINSHWNIKIQKEVIHNLVPSAPIVSNIISYQGKEIVLISVWPGSKKPYSFNGKIYVTHHGSTKIASSIELKSLIKSRKKTEFNWERQVVLGASIEDLDHQEIHKTLHEYQKKNYDAVPISKEDFLLRLGLMKNGNLTNAAILLFAINPTIYHNPRLE
ncbi:MAG: putative DNA binding domain-containing protein [Flavobacteriaceae bacterium]|nr:putative DNA binding domain-containing protein [Flavobacteriaceae bacterium]